MSANVKNQLPVLQALCNCRPKIRRQIIENAHGDLIKSICECCTNVLNNNVNLGQKETKRLRKYKKTIRLIGDKTKSLKLKKKAILQSGGSFLLTLIPAAISTILSLLGR